MESFSLNALEFPALLDVVAQHASSPLGAEAVRALRPAADAVAIREAFRPVEELMAIMAQGLSLPLDPIPDIRPILARLEREGSFVEGEEWLSIRKTLGLVERVKRFLEDRRRDCPTCAAMAGELAPMPEVSRAIDSVVDEKGRVRDNASPALAELRRSMQRERSRLQRQMESLLRDFGSSGALQGSYWTMRKGRNVIPVRSGQRGAVAGLVHDASQSGETLFIEPYAVVEISNRLADLEGREAEEVRRVLIALGDEVRPRAGELLRNIEILVQLDGCNARARYGYRHGLTSPAFSAGDGFSIRAARHPLLLAAGRGETIPIDLGFRPGQRVLILTGPNTGGKTTTLKTLGLLCLMAQSAIPVPAHPDSRFPIFSSVFADIGDEQSLAKGLSTFSGHLLSIQRVLENAGLGSLVLFDELGTATDPLQGGALGAAVLERLARAGVTVLATTHLPMLKQWAYDYPLARNAATRFDESSGRPAFQILYDQPGASEAFRIARQLGFPADIIDDAQRRVPEGERALDSILASLEIKERELRQEIDRTTLLREELEKQKAEIEDLKTRLREAERRQRQNVLADRRKALEEARSRIERRIANLGDKRELESARTELRAEEDEVQAETVEIEMAAPESIPFEELSVGINVYVPALRDTGRVVRLHRKRESAVVEARGARIEIPARQLARVPRGLPAPETRSPPPRIIRSEKTPPTGELNLHGMRVEPALEELERFLDRAILDRIDVVSILVGHGRLRQAVEETLRASAIVASYRRATDEEGGDATVIARLGEKKEEPKRREAGIQAPEESP
ncbi:MAG: endonuclease MutS2 [Candidatus Sumerlaeota bacterium]|nr:endonuclease MutS2 [Candidatus Sumerlaeota bacterium]